MLLLEICGQYQNTCIPFLLAYFESDLAADCFSLWCNTSRRPIYLILTHMYAPSHTTLLEIFGAASPTRVFLCHLWPIAVLVLVGYIAAKEVVRGWYDRQCHKTG